MITDRIRVADGYPMMRTPDAFDCQIAATFFRKGWIPVSRFTETVRALMLAGFAFFVCLTAPSLCSAQVVQLHTSTGKGSAVCVGTTEADGQLFVTVRHNFEDGPEGRIQFKGRWYAIENLELSDSEDLACFTSSARTRPLPIFEGSLTQGAAVEVPGFGPLFNGRNDSLLVRHGRVEDLELVVNSDSQVVPGDSGCPVVYQDRTVGIVRAFFNDSPRETQIIPAVRVHKFLTKVQWQCISGQGCYIRQRVRQPIAGLVIPIGPPQIETQIIPRQQPTPRPIPDENFAEPKVVQGPRGERGPAGPAGKDGRDGVDGVDGRDGSGPDPKQVEDIVVAWLESNRDSIRGPAGPQGQPGKDGSVSKSLIDRIQALEEKLATTPTTSDDRRLLYFTSTKGCDKCRPTDATVEELKAAGYPITVIDLDPSETEIKGVPRIHVLKDARNVSGQSNVATFLGLLVP
jgi:hypothetical protein